MPYKFSPSSLNLLKECPRCFWLHFNKGVKRPDGIFPSLPRGMDRIFKEHFDVFMNKGLLPPELASLNGSLKLFDNQELLKTWRNNLVGIQWKDETGNLLRGAVDNILQKEKKLIVLDYKTRGYALKEDTADHYKDQLDIYNFLLRKNGFETEDYAYLLFYYPEKVDEDGKITFHTDLIKMPVSGETAEKILKKALAVLESPIPPEAGECKYCKWVKDCEKII